MTGMQESILKRTADAKDYLKEAVAAAEFIKTRRVETPNGIYWSLKDAGTGKDVYYDEICFYAGSSGIIHYLVQLWDVTRNEEYLNECREAARYIEYRWKNEQDLKKNFSKWAFSTGYAGVAYVLLELYAASKDEKYRQLIEEIVETMIKAAKPAKNGEGYVWSHDKGIIGDSGTILFLLSAAKKLHKEEWKEFAVKAGKNLMSDPKEYGEGKRYYVGIDPSYFGFPDDYIDPNFPMGTAGVAFTLLRLYEESNDETFLKAVEGVPEFLESVAVGDQDAWIVPYSLPNVRNLFYLGYCHGPIGTSRFFYKKYKMTNDSRWLDIAKRLVNGVVQAGAPEVHSPGYWNTHNQCCGTAGLTNAFLGMWAETGENKYLDYAIRTGAQLLGWADHVEENGKKITRWYQAIDRVAPDRITTPIGFYDGAAGIGWALLQLYLAKTDSFHVSRAIDDPYPTSAVFQK